MPSQTKSLRGLLKKESFVYVPVAYDALGARLVQQIGFKAVYTGGFVTGSLLGTSEPLLTMDEQVRVAGMVAHAVSIPALADGGAGFGEPLHTMRTVREFIRAGVAGIHIEDQHYPKRAHYHRALGQTSSMPEFIDKIRFACAERDKRDADFVVIARTETCRFDGLKEAIKRINTAADAGADMGLIFPRNDFEMKRAPKLSKIPLVYVLSRGNRDGRPVPTGPQLEDMGYKMVIDAVTYLLASLHFAHKAYQEIKQTGAYTGMSGPECIAARKQVEDLLGLDDYYRIEEATVEKAGRRKASKRV